MSAEFWQALETELKRATDPNNAFGALLMVQSYSRMEFMPDFSLDMPEGKHATIDSQIAELVKWRRKAMDWANVSDLENAIEETITELFRLKGRHRYYFVPSDKRIQKSYSVNYALSQITDVLAVQKLPYPRVWALGCLLAIGIARRQFKLKRLPRLDEIIKILKEKNKEEQKRRLDRSMGDRINGFYLALIQDIETENPKLAEKYRNEYLNQTRTERLGLK